MILPPSTDSSAGNSTYHRLRTADIQIKYELPCFVHSFSLVRQTPPIQELHHTSVDSNVQLYSRSAAGCQSHSETNNFADSNNYHHCLTKMVAITTIVKKSDVFSADTFKDLHEFLSRDNNVLNDFYANFATLAAEAQFAVTWDPDCSPADASIVTWEPLSIEEADRRRFAAGNKSDERLTVEQLLENLLQQRKHVCPGSVVFNFASGLHNIATGTGFLNLLE